MASEAILLHPGKGRRFQPGGERSTIEADGEAVSSVTASTCLTQLHLISLSLSCVSLSLSPRHLHSSSPNVAASCHPVTDTSTSNDLSFKPALFASSRVAVNRYIGVCARFSALSWNALNNKPILSSSLDGVCLLPFYIRQLLGLERRRVNLPPPHR